MTFGDYTASARNSVVMPGNHVPEGTVIGALSFVPGGFTFEPWTVYAGVPIRLIRPRNRADVMDQVSSSTPRLAGRKDKNEHEQRRFRGGSPRSAGGADGVLQRPRQQLPQRRRRHDAHFERGCAELLGAKHAVARTSGTTAISLALAALGVGAR